jgi:hypothetical protein
MANDHTTSLMLMLVVASLTVAVVVEAHELVARKTPAQIAPYPPMQWHSFGLFTGDDEINEANMEEIAVALVSSGMVRGSFFEQGVALEDAIGSHNCLG